jgi:hypothetical protein
MSEKFILLRCLHFGRLCRETIDQWPTDSQMDWERYRARNIPLLAKLTHSYGACAILAHADDRVVGQLRFYPKAVWDMNHAGEMCLQQDFPNGPAADFVDTDFPPLEHVLETGKPSFPDYVHGLAPNALIAHFNDFRIQKYEEGKWLGDWGGPPADLVRMIARKN